MLVRIFAEDRIKAVLIVFCALAFPIAGAADGHRVASDGTVYALQINNHGARLNSSRDTLYLGRDCDASSPQYGRGSWGWANGGFVVQFIDRTRIGFPKMDPPIPECSP